MRWIKLLAGLLITALNDLGLIHEGMRRVGAEGMRQHILARRFRDTTATMIGICARYAPSTADQRWLLRVSVKGRAPGKPLAKILGYAPGMRRILFWLGLSLQL